MVQDVQKELVIGNGHWSNNYWICVDDIKT